MITHPTVPEIGRGCSPTTKMAPLLTFAAGVSLLPGRQALGHSGLRNGRLCVKPARRASVAHATLAQGSDVGARAPRGDYRDGARERPRYDRTDRHGGGNRDNRGHRGREHTPFVPQEGMTYYTECGVCSAAYPLDPTSLGSGRKVVCAVCGNSWFQRADRLRTVHSGKGLKDYPVDQKDALMADRAERRERARARGPRTAGGGGGGRFQQRGPQHTVFIGNLPFDATEDELKAHVGSAAEVSRVTIIVDRETGRSRGFGFATVGSEEDVRKVVDELDGGMFNGRNLTLREGNKK